jgi:UDP-N-acetylglucosamine acyltransferase
VIHPTAIVHPKAVIGDHVSIGPYTIIEEDVKIGGDCEIGPHVLVASGTRMGDGCRIFKGASLGTPPQDLKFGGEKTTLVIGNHTVIREFCTLNRGTKATGETRLGSHCLLMAYCHLAHDCHVGDYFVAANLVNLAGHVTIGNYVRASGNMSIIQFLTIGDYSFLGAHTLIAKDIVPFAFVAPEPLRIVDINKVGLERAGFSEERRREIKRAYKLLFRSDLPFNEALARLESDFPGNADIASLSAFARASKRGILGMRRTGDEENPN